MSVRVLDGEGTLPRRLTLLGESGGASLENPHGLNTEAVFDWLLALPGRRRNLWWHGDWDINMLLCDLSETALRQLSRERRAQWAGYRIDYIPRHLFKVAGERGTFYSTDLGRFSEGGLAEAATSWGVAVPEIVQSGKATRGSITEWPERRVSDYNAAELEVSHQLALRVYNALEAHGLKGDSPGQCAASLLRRWGAEDWLRDVEELGDLPLRAFFGGRVEAEGWGRRKGPVWGYDLTAAYAWGLTQLPNLAATVWEHRPDSYPLSPWDLVRVRWDRVTDSLPRWNPLPHRGKENRICYPDHGEGWYWAKEFSAATLFPGIEWEVLDCWGAVDWNPFLFDHLPSEPFSEPVLAYFQEREAFRGTAQGELLKRVLNAVVGQISRATPKPSPYHSRTWAGMVTASIRAEIAKVLAREGDKVIAVTTDGLLTRAPLEVPMRDGFGEWRLTGSSPGPLDLIGAGIASVPTPRSRGHKASELPPLPQVVESLWRAGPFSALEYPRDHFVTLDEALAWDRLDLWRTWQRREGSPRIVDLSENLRNPSAGRIGSPRGGYSRQAIFESRVEGGTWEHLAPGSVDGPSQPYQEGAHMDQLEWTPQAELLKL